VNSHIMPMIGLPCAFAAWAYARALGIIASKCARGSSAGRPAGALVFHPAPDGLAGGRELGHDGDIVAFPEL
jgi:hypothetical protein